MTTNQIRNRTKTVTRRLGWADLAEGDLLCAIVKGQGLKKGEKVERLAVIRVVSLTFEPLSAILGYKHPWEECGKEGFPNLSAREFVKMFCQSHRCDPSEVITRIEFEYVEDDEGPPSPQPRHQVEKRRNHRQMRKKGRLK